MASVGELTVTLDRETAVAALLTIRDRAFGALANPASDRGDALADIRRVAQEALDQCHFQKRSHADQSAVMSQRLTLTSGTPLEPTDPQASVTYVGYGPRAQATVVHFLTIPLTQEVRDHHPFASALAKDCYTGIARSILGPGCGDNRLSADQELRDDWRAMFSYPATPDECLPVSPDRAADEPPADTPQIVEGKPRSGSL